MRSSNRSIRASRAALCLGLAMVLIPASGRAGGFAKMSNLSPEDTKAYWTPERFQEARPLPVAEIDFDGLGIAPEEESAADVPAAFGSGGAPTAAIRPDVHNRLFERSQGEAAADLQPNAKASGTSGGYFTSARLVPAAADLAYPYSTVGKLFFTIPGQGNFYCSAAVLRPRVVLTAAQCIHSGTSNPGFFTNFQFVPAYRNGSAPFGTWTWNYVAVSTTWSTGGGHLPNAADYGMIEMKDQTINGSVRKIGDVVGFLGYQTLRLRPNHAHILAYASNFDGGERMHQVTAQSLRAASQNNVEYGSDMRGGSQGGPLIQDFGDNTALVKVIAVVSYFNSSTAIKIEGASIPDSRFTSLLTSVCNHRSGNC